MKLISWPNSITSWVSYAHFNCFECKKRILITSTGLYTECKHYPFNANK